MMPPTLPSSGPTLLVAGEFDTNAPPAVMQKMEGQIAGSRQAELAGVGHLQNLEAPDQFDALVLDFLASTRKNLH
jgi:pimeloyl-ACP methyl ester carboxylesterase